MKHFGGVCGKVQVADLGRRHLDELKGLLVLLDLGAADLPHDRLLLVLVDGYGRAVYPRAGLPVLEAHIRAGQHVRVAHGDGGLVQLEYGRVGVDGRVRIADELIDGLGRVGAAQLGAHRILGRVGVELSGQVAARGQVLEAEEVGPACGAAAARILAHELDLPQRLGRGGRSGREARRAAYEHHLRVAVLVARQVLLLLGMEEPYHVALRSQIQLSIHYFLLMCAKHIT